MADAEHVRAALKTSGVVGQHDEAVTVFDSLSWTTAQKQNAGQFAPGQSIRFLRAAQSFARHETTEVVAVDGRLLTVRRADGSTAVFDPSRLAASFDVGQTRALPVATGDVLLLQANHGRTFINGERVSVRSIQNGRITLTDGRQLPAGFNTFTHGYAVTSHSSQGKTVDEVLLVASSRSFAAVNREQFYVSISRGRERVQIFTDDAELLARRVTAGGARKAAVELQGLRDDLAHLGCAPRRPAAHQPPASHFRTVRPLRATRLTRLPGIQRLIRVAEDFACWLGERLGTDQAVRIEHTEVVQATTAAPTDRRRPAQQITQPSTSGHSRGVGV